MIKILIIIFTSIGYLNIIFFNLLRIKQTRKALPKRAFEIYNLSDYDKTINYLNRSRKLRIIKTLILFIITLLLLIGNVFSLAYNYLETNVVYSDFTINLLIMLPIIFIYLIINIGFDYIDKFLKEDRLGINKSLLKIFILDKAIITVFTLISTAAIIYIAQDFGSNEIDADEDLLSFVLILVLIVLGHLLKRYFNKLMPFPEGNLKDDIEKLAIEHKFKFKNVYITNASKRTNKVNAYFQGFSFFRKIVIYDTLIEQFRDEEILAVFAHELAHAKNRDVLKMVLISIPLIYGIIYSFHLLYNFEQFYLNFKFLEANVSLTLFTYYALNNFLKIIYNLIFNPISRKAEYRADYFSAINVGKAPTINVLKNLTEKNLSDVNPHPLDVFLNYTHPPTLERIEAVYKIAEKR